MGRLAPQASCGRKPPASEVQIGERQQREHLCAIFGDAAIAHLAIAARAEQGEIQAFRLMQRQATLLEERPISPVYPPWRAWSLPKVRKHLKIMVPWGGLTIAA